VQTSELYYDNLGLIFEAKMAEIEACLVGMKSKAL
jgi:hypothetical protein